ARSSGFFTSSSATEIRQIRGLREDDRVFVDTCLAEDQSDRRGNPMDANAQRVLTPVAAAFASLRCPTSPPSTPTRKNAHAKANAPQVNQGIAPAATAMSHSTPRPTPRAIGPAVAERAAAAPTPAAMMKPKMAPTRSSHVNQAVAW